MGSLRWRRTIKNEINHDDNISGRGYTDDHVLYSSSSTDIESVSISLANFEKSVHGWLKSPEVESRKSVVHCF